MSASRSYNTGRTRTFTLEATLTLHRCGGTQIWTGSAEFPALGQIDASNAWWAAADYTAANTAWAAYSPPNGGDLSPADQAILPPFDIGYYHAGGWYHPQVVMHQGTPRPFGGGQVNFLEIAFLGCSATVSSGMPQGGDWTTIVTLSTPTQNKTSLNLTGGAAVGIDGDVVLNVTISSAMHEVAYEFDGGIANPLQRPYWAGTAALALAWVPDSQVEVSVTGVVSDSLTDTLADLATWTHNSNVTDDPTAFINYGLFQATVNGEVTTPFIWSELLDVFAEEAGGSGFSSDWAAYSMFQTATLGDIPSRSTIACEVTGFSISTIGSLYDWAFYPGGAVQSNPPSPFGFTPSNAPVPGLGEQGSSFLGSPKYDVTVNGTIRDWRGPIEDIPVTFTPGDPKPPVMHDFTDSSAVIDSQMIASIAVPDDLGGLGATDGPLFRYGASYNAITIGKALSLTVEDFSTIGGTNGWTGNAHVSSGPTYSSPYLTATGDGSSTQPALNKNLNSDFNGLAADPATWWAANRSGFSASANDWWDNQGAQWWKVGKRLTAGSDIFNWSGFRYLYLAGYADVACAVTVTITWQRYNASPPTAALFDTKTQSWTVQLGTTVSDQVIDLGFATETYQNTLRHVTEIQVTWPNGRTIHLSQLELKTTSHSMDIHQSSGDNLLGILVDGKHALTMNERADYMGMWPFWRLIGGSYTGCLLISELVTELNLLQEAMTATAGSSPDNSTPSYVVFLNEQFRIPFGMALAAQRSFGTIYMAPAYIGTIVMQANLGVADQVLVFDATTHLPAKARLDAFDGSTPPVALDSTLADGTGYGLLQDTFVGNVVWASRGQPSQTFEPVATHRAQWTVLNLTGQPLTTQGGGLDYALDLRGEPFLIQALSATVREITTQDMEGTFQPTQILTESISGFSQCIFSDHEHYLAGIDSGGFAKLWHSTDEFTWSSLGVVVSSPQYSATCIRTDPSSTIHLWLVDPSGEVWKILSTDGGSTFSSPAAVSGLPTCALEKVDMRFSGESWIAAIPVATGAIEFYSSVDGEAWAHEVQVAAAGTNPVLLQIPPGRDWLIVYLTATQISSRRVEDTGSGWTVGSEILVGKYVSNPAAYRNPQHSWAAFPIPSGNLLFAESLDDGDHWTISGEDNVTLNYLTLQKMVRDLSFAIYGSVSGGGVITGSYTPPLLNTAGTLNLPVAANQAVVGELIIVSTPFTWPLPDSSVLDIYLAEDGTIVPVNTGDPNPGTPSSPCIYLGTATTSGGAITTITGSPTLLPVPGELTFDAPLSETSSTVSIPAADTSTDGYLSHTDWNTFNSKLSSFTESDPLSLHTGGGTMTGTITSRMVTPSADNTYTLGDPTHSWQSAYINTAIVGYITLQNSGMQIQNFSSGSPNGSLIAVPGSLTPNTDGNLWIKKSGSSTSGWQQVPSCLSGSATLSFGTALAQTSEDLTISVPGATVGSPVCLGSPAPPANGTFSAFVSSTGVVTVRFSNISILSLTPSSGVFTVLVFQ